MSAKIRCTDGPLGRLRVVRDFLPPPEDLVFRDEAIKITIALSKGSVDFFKGEARKGPYHHDCRHTFAACLAMAGANIDIQCENRKRAALSTNRHDRDSSIRSTQRVGSPRSAAV
jgi:hypothetical protein